MVKIKNVFGDEYRGKQKHAVYQKRYGKQIRRIKEDKKKNTAPGQKEQQERFRVGLSWYSSLSYVEKEGLKQFLNERGINLTAQQYAIKIALDRGKVSKVVSQEQIIAYDYVEGWHAKGWDYRQRITISNGNSYDLTDYQVKIILDGSNVGQNFDWSRNGEDLRFYDENGNKLNYWVEIWDEVNKRAVIWVKVPQIPASGGTYIYMYYGNTAAQSESDGAAVFEFFDDFEGASLDASKWTVVSGSSYYVKNSELHVTDRDTHIASKRSFSVPAVFETKMRTISVNKQLGFELGDNQNHDRIKMYFLVTGAEDVYIDANGDGTYDVVEDIFVDQVGDTYDIVSVAVTGTQIVLDFIRNMLRTTKTYNYGWTADTYIGLGGYRAGVESATENEIAVDWVRVRKYADVEPHASLGSEEHCLVEVYTTIQVEHVIVEHSGIRDIYILDENEKEIVRFTDLSNLEQGDIKTIWKWENNTGKTAGYVIITSVAGTINKVRL